MTLPFSGAVPDRNVPTRFSDLAAHLRSADASMDGMRSPPIFERISPSVGRDSRGRWFEFGRKQPAYKCYDLDGDGIYETPAFCFFGERNNLIPYGSDLTQWTGVNSPAIPEANSLGSARIWRVTDDSASQEGVQSPQFASRFTVNGNGVIRTLIGKGDTTTPSITLRDITNNVDRGRLDVSWVGNAPDITTVSGAVVDSVELAGKTSAGLYMYDIAWKGAGTLTSADHAIIYRPAQSAALQGFTYFGGSHVEDASTYPLPFVLNPGAGSRVMNRDEWRVPYDGHVGPAAILLDMIENGNIKENGVRVCTIGATTGVGPELRIDVSSGVYRVLMDSATSSVSSALTGITMPTIGQRFQLYVVMNPESEVSYSVRIGIKVGAGPWQYASPSGPLLMPTQFGWSGYPGACFIQFGHALNNRQSTLLIEGKVSLAALSQAQIASAFG